MFEPFSRVTVACFGLSYLIVFLLELSRLFFRLPVRFVVIIGFTLLGLATHLPYLINLARHESGQGVLSSWHDWCVLASLVLTVAYLGLAIRRPRNTVGVFLLPLILLLIGVATVFRQSPAFSTDDALHYWGLFHGVFLLLGMVSVMLGFSAGIMYFAQARRLKQHRSAADVGVRLPSLEWLQRFNRESLYMSAGLLGLGLLSGFVMNLNRPGRPLPWSDPVVWTSGLLLVWMLAVVAFEYFYRPARQGHKVAYLTLASFAFMLGALAVVLSGQHGTDRSNQSERAAPLVPGGSP